MFASSFVQPRRWSAWQVLFERYPVKELASAIFSEIGELRDEVRTMLVLSRKVGQRIVIGDNITIVVNRVAGNRVTLGIEAPEDVHIMRGELEKHQHEFAEDVEPAPATLPFLLQADVAETLPCLPRLAR